MRSGVFAAARFARYVPTPLAATASSERLIRLAV